MVGMSLDVSEKEKKSIKYNCPNLVFDVYYQPQKLSAFVFSEALLSSWVLLFGISHGVQFLLWKIETLEDFEKKKKNENIVLNPFHKLTLF